MRKTNARGGAAIAALLILLALPAHAQDADSLWRAGTEAYAAQQWQDAIASWTAIAGSGLESSELYYNLGGAYYKAGDPAHAVLWYERALKADPLNADARVNLEFVRSQLQDRIEEVPEFFLEAWGRKACWLLPSGVWAILFLVLLAGTLAMVLLFLLGGGRARKAGFFAGLALLLCSLLCLDFAFWQKTDARRTDGAVITVPVAEVKSSPGSGVSLFVLHEGTKVKVLEEVGGWDNIELADGRQGWLLKESAERI